MNSVAGAEHPLVLLLGWTLVHFLWQAGVVGIVFAAARASLSPLNCRGRYALGIAALIGLAFLPIATFAFLQAHIQWDDANAPMPGASAMSWSSIVVDRGVEADAIAVSLLPWLVGGWCIGVVVMLLRAGRQWLRLARIAGRFADSVQELDGVFAALRHRFEVAARVTVKVSSMIDTPMLIGWLKPIVLLPTAVAIGFPRTQLELVLAHELGHLRRYDHLVNLAQMIVETVLFYHPVVHWISREIRDQRELCCDQLVVEVMAVESRRYARALASLEEVRYASRMALAASGGELVERVRRLVSDSTDTPIDRRASRLGPIAMVALLVVLGAAILRRVDAPTLLLGPIVLDWSAQTPLRVTPLLAGLVLVQPRIRIAPVDPPAREGNPTIADRASLVQSPARAPTPAAVAAAGASEESSPDPITIARTQPPSASVAPASTKVPSTAVLSKAKPTTLAPLGAAVPPLAKPAPVASKIVATRSVAPQFPVWSRAGNGRVDVSFNIADDGSVRNIAVSGDVPAAFESAAKSALRQWRFDPVSVVDHGERFTQSFVFQGAPRGDNSDDGCVRVTGSMICRSPVDVAARMRSGSAPPRR